MDLLRKIASLVLLAGLLLTASGCIRLFGRAGYYKETPEERAERAVGFDTAKAFEEKQAKGSVVT